MSKLLQIKSPSAFTHQSVKTDRNLLSGDWAHFPDLLDAHNVTLKRRRLKTLQINVGKLCNQTCRHCHVEAGPRRTEQMTRETAERVIELIDLERPNNLEVVDITGGAPELNSQFRYLVEEIRQRQLRVIDRCNLTVLFQPGQEDTAKFLGDQQVEIIASLPCYSSENVTQQRGNGVFAQSIQALQLLNTIGYGYEDSGLTLDLVYNPVGPFLPPLQEELQEEYKLHLSQDFGIVFNRLYTITNMPIKRFLYDLKHSGKLEEYMALLVNSFNVSAAENVMCRDMISIGWEGSIFDCDFNQMLELPIPGSTHTIWDVNSFAEFDGNRITVDDHCLGCTAGAGSSCGGALA
tara:strand:- start:1871 stop:2917 length:1047 start_codon:yes stop_codon:yes gene_type:complete